MRSAITNIVKESLQVQETKYTEKSHNIKTQDQIHICCHFCLSAHSIQPVNSLVLRKGKRGKEKTLEPGKGPAAKSQRLLPGIGLPHAGLFTALSCGMIRTERQLALQLPHICRRLAQLLRLPGFQEPSSSPFMSSPRAEVHTQDGATTQWSFHRQAMPFRGKHSRLILS